MAQKTLIIGIGSTGMAVCEDILQRIVDEYGSLDRVPWIKAVAFETARITGTLGLMRDRTHSIGIASEEYSALVMRPTEFDDMAFNEWQDPEVIGSANGSTEGAGNMRMIGRLSWIYKPNLLIFESEVKKLVDQLTELTEQQANEALGRTPYQEKPDIRFDRDATSGKERIAVFVCGTLTGGTCSGCFVDVGFYLRTWPGVHSQFSSIIGLFGIPHVSYPVETHNANAYAGLMELNHFYHRGAVYRAKFPTRPQETVTKGMGPYNDVFLCHPPSGVAGAEKAITRSFGQFVYLSAMSQMGDSVRAKLINPSTVYAGIPDSRGNPMNYSSLGVGVIEYPAEHLMKGCAYRLAAAAIEGWKNTQGIEQGQAHLFVTRKTQPGSTEIGPELGRDTVRSELRTAPPDRPALGEIVATYAGRARVAGLAGNMQELADAEAELESGFDHTIRPDSPIARVFVETIKANGEGLADNRLERMRQMFARDITDDERGPVFCRDLADHTIAYCTEWMNQMRSAMGSDPLADLRANLERARQRLAECHQAFSLSFGWRPTAANVCAQEYVDAATEYFEARIGQACETYEAELCSRVIDLCQLVRKRIAHEFYGVSRWADALHQELDRRADDYSRREPEINGELLYDPQVTIDRDYEICMDEVKNDGSAEVGGQYRGERFARRKMVRGWKGIVEQLLKDKNESFFDEPITAAEQSQPKPVRNQEIHDLTALARPYFNRLLQVSVLDRLYAQPDPDRIVDEVWNKTTGFLDISDNRNPIVRGTAGRGAPHKPTFAFFRRSKSPAEGSNEAKLKSRLESKIATFEELVEPYRVIMVQARTTYSLSMIAGFNPDIDATFRDQYMNRRRTDTRTLHSRSERSIRWRPLDGPFAFPDRALIIARVLAGIAFGRIRGAGDSPLVFDFQALRPGEAGGPIEIDHDLDEAARRLHERPSAAVALKNAIDEEVRKATADDVVAKLDDFTKSVGRFKLTLAGTELDSAGAYFHLLPLVSAIPGLREAWFARYPERPRPEHYLRTDSPDERTHGYYCPSGECNAFLADLTQGNQLPSICPSCGSLLLLSD